MDIERIKQKAVEEKVNINLIFKEYLHSVVLDFFFRSNLFETLVFQGGTALRFFYKGIRYSEDLDFVIRNKKGTFSLKEIDKKIKKITSFVERTIPIVKKCDLKIQRGNGTLKRYILNSDIDILKMQDKTRIEVAIVPSYMNYVSLLKTEYLPFPPAVVVESAKEILIDKIVAFGGRNYLKGRDIWDIYFLTENLKLKLNKEEKKIIKKKRNDYNIKENNFKDTFSKNLSLLKFKGEEIFVKEIKNYLPIQYQKIFKNQYSTVCKKTFKSLSELIK